MLILLLLCILQRFQPLVLLTGLVPPALPGGLLHHRPSLGGGVAQSLRAEVLAAPVVAGRRQVLPDLRPRTLPAHPGAGIRPRGGRGRLQVSEGPALLAGDGQVRGGGGDFSQNKDLVYSTRSIANFPISGKLFALESILVI